MMFVRMALPTLMMAGVLFGAAGRLDAWNVWAWLLLMYGVAATTYTVLLKRSPGLIAERVKPPSDGDKATRRLIVLPFLAHLVVAGLDLRFGWSVVPTPLVVIGLALWGAGFLLVSWVLFTNPFASSAVRIQEERKQKVIDRGPYGLVRHPMYLAVWIVCLGSGPALGSWWAALTMVPVVGIFARRTLIEDAMLRRELEGYVEYSTRVKWRVVPLVF